MISDELLQRAEAFSKKLLASDSTGHDWWHTARVRNTARTIAEIEGADAKLVDLTVILHDVGDRKVIGKPDDDYTIAQNFLRSNCFEQYIIDEVMLIIRTMSFSRTLDMENKAPNTLEFKIVQDADRLDALGAIGIGRAFAFGGHRGRKLYSPDQNATMHTSRDSYIDSEGSTLYHFDEKLFHLKDLMNTESARKIAVERDNFMHEFYDRFLAEWSGDV